ncbi:hypothetical protein [Falsiroseomonas oryziterrae]|uniref:hypothetical protein n=1 Tax=Falsiroseomonas oryziterrae TaxID=2911368 RepID=UPI001F29C649|nr:hypothetical protein [Roseomonas sp. NPKOSM-4]
MTPFERLAGLQAVEASEVMAWTILAGGVVFAACAKRLPEGAAAVLAGVAAVATKAALLPLL